MKASSARRGWTDPEYRIRVTFRVPLKFAFGWCTDYTPQDASLKGGSRTSGRLSNARPVASCSRTSRNPKPVESGRGTSSRCVPRTGGTWMAAAIAGMSWRTTSCRASRTAGPSSSCVGGGGPSCPRRRGPRRRSGKRPRPARLEAVRRGNGAGLPAQSPRETPPNEVSGPGELQATPATIHSDCRSLF